MKKAKHTDAEYSEDLWREQVEQVMVYRDRRMLFQFKDGTETEIQA